MKNVQIIDGASNATFSIFQATEDEFAIIFPVGREMEIADDLIERVGQQEADRVLAGLWERPDPQARCGSYPWDVVLRCGPPARVPAEFHAGGGLGRALYKRGSAEAIPNTPVMSAFHPLRTRIVKRLAGTLSRHLKLDRGGRVTMKPYIIGAIILWFACGIVGAVMLGQQRIDVPTICGGPMTFWAGLNAPVDK